MREMAITYLLDEEQLERLERIAGKYNAAGIEITPEGIFSMIMQGGSRREIDDKLSISERTISLQVKRFMQKNKDMDTVSSNEKDG